MTLSRPQIDRLSYAARAGEVHALGNRSSTVRALAKRGLLEKHPYSAGQIMCHRYRITDAGRKALADAKAKALK